MISVAPSPALPPDGEVVAVEDAPGAGSYAVTNEASPNTEPPPAAPSLSAPENEAAPEDKDDETAGPLIGAIAVEGAELPNEALSAIIEPMIGTVADDDALASLTQQLAELARGQGMIFASATIPPQNLSLGMLRVKVDQGFIDAVEVEGSNNPHLLSVVGKLQGQVVREGMLNRTLLLATDIPDIWVKSASVEQDGERNILRISVEESGDDFYAHVDNYGSDTYGPVRASLTLRSEAVLLPSDEAVLSFRVNPLEPSELLSASGQYEIGIGNDGLRAGIAGSIGLTEAGGRFASRSIGGETDYVSTYANYPLIRTPEGSLWLTGEAELLAIQTDEDGQALREDRTTTLSVGLLGDLPLASGRLRARSSVVRGVELFGSTRSDDPLRTRFYGDGVFTKLDFWADWKGSLSGDLKLNLALWGQVADRPLLASREFSLGGAYSVRGYDFSEMSGDNGIAALIELSYEIDKPATWIDRLTPYVFVDGGYVDNLRRSDSDGELYSLGGGLRVDFGEIDFEAESALPLNKPRYSSGDKSPHFNIGMNAKL